MTIQNNADVFLHSLEFMTFEELAECAKVSKFFYAQVEIIREQRATGFGLPPPPPGEKRDLAEVRSWIKKFQMTNQAIEFLKSKNIEFELEETPYATYCALLDVIRANKDDFFNKDDLLFFSQMGFFDAFEIVSDQDFVRFINLGFAPEAFAENAPIAQIHAKAALETCFAKSIECGNLEFVKYFVSQKAFFIQNFRFMAHPLKYALQYRQTEIFKFLVSKCSLWKNNQQAETALEYAFDEQLWGACELLIDNDDYMQDEEDTRSFKFYNLLWGSMYISAYQAGRIGLVNKIASLQPRDSTNFAEMMNDRIEDDNWDEVRDIISNLPAIPLWNINKFIYRAIEARRFDVVASFLRISPEPLDEINFKEIFKRLGKVLTGPEVFQICKNFLDIK